MNAQPSKKLSDLLKAAASLDNNGFKKEDIGITGSSRKALEQAYRDAVSGGHIIPICALNSPYQKSGLLMVSETGKQLIGLHA